MFEALARAVEELEVPADPSALTEVWALVDQLTAKATMAAAAFDEHDLWDVDGDTSMTGWLRHRAGMTSRDAAVVSRNARRLLCAPVTAAAWLAGGLTGGQVAAVAVNVHDETADLWAQHESAVLPTLTPLPVHQVTAAMRVWAQTSPCATAPSVVQRHLPGPNRGRTRAVLAGSGAPSSPGLREPALPHRYHRKTLHTVGVGGTHRSSVWRTQRGAEMPETSDDGSHLHREDVLLRPENMKLLNTPDAWESVLR